MQFLANLGRWTIRSDWVRALVLKWIRAGLIWLGPIVTAALLRHGADADATNAFVSYFSGVILSGTGVAFSMHDAKSVHLQIQSAAKGPKSDAAVDECLAEHSL
ncbi:MAG: hypothetical protein ACLQUZ_12820 [Rhizomicrobium sp.]